MIWDPLSAEKRTYYFDNNYVVKTGWIYEDGNWYYLNKLGNFGDDSYNPLPIGEVAKGWTQDFHVTIDIDRSKPAPWYYLDASGKMLTDWQKVNGKWYYFGSSGSMATGWKYVRGKWYYLDNKNGDMKTGWYQDGSTWYYLDPSNGDMKIGWTKVNGKWYYLNSNGAMVTGSQTIDGKVYNFASSGEWI